jgi:hypothetical protein
VVTARPAELRVTLAAFVNVVPSVDVWIRYADA